VRDRPFVKIGLPSSKLLDDGRVRETLTRDGGRIARRQRAGRSVSRSRRRSSTEVGYVGRDVESNGSRPRGPAVDMVREEMLGASAQGTAARRRAVLLDLLLRHPPARRWTTSPYRREKRVQRNARAGSASSCATAASITRTVEVEVRERNDADVRGGVRLLARGDSTSNVKDMLPGLFQGRGKKRRLRNPGSARHLTRKGAENGSTWRRGRTRRSRVEQTGIIFLDEIDKVAGREAGHGPDVSREGVPARSAAIGRGDDGQYQVGMVRTRSHPVCPLQARSTCRASDLIPNCRADSHPARVEPLDVRFRPHSHRAPHA